MTRPPESEPAAAVCVCGKPYGLAPHPAGGYEWHFGCIEWSQPLDITAATDPHWLGVNDWPARECLPTTDPEDAD